jgi:hypothetical protein
MPKVAFVSFQPYYNEEESRISDMIFQPRKNAQNATGKDFTMHYVLQSIRALERREDFGTRRERGGRSGQGNVGQGNGHQAVSLIPLTSIPLTSALQPDGLEASSHCGCGGSRAK